MSLSVVIDPSALELADQSSDCREVIRHLMSRRLDILYLDHDDRLLQMYETLARQNDESLAHDLYKWICNQEAFSDTTGFLRHIIHNRASGLCTSYSCANSDNNELEIILIETAAKVDAVIFTPSPRLIERSDHRRCFHDPQIRDQVRNAYGAVVKDSSHVADLVRPSPPRPGTVEELERMLPPINGRRQESGSVEFKHPGAFVTPSIVKSANEAVCAMANSKGGGYVFIGIDAEGNITGVPLRYKPARADPTDKTLDEMLTLLHPTQHFRPFSPLENIWHIAVNGDRYVFVLFVDDQENPIYTYCDARFRRYGPKTVRVA